ncbi:hypothetical protein [Aquimarina spongiae]|uniref:Bulb-type lectin domain-containing protein n=1 Tax=Aquimarina spongiae TaxID=570521 RepID=A0A1M6FF43_9FLAO|nr:hypothetical protein [Aquimarina spongiae]SHI96277.1 hypothetical protein SAMN04488508_104253 [Aquimarina spongiae]
MKRNIKISLVALLAILLYSCSNDDDNDNSDVINFQGEIDWIKTFGGSDEESARSVIETSDGGYAVFGFTKSTDGNITEKTLNVNDYWLLKLDAEGTLQWNKTIGGSGDDQGQEVIQTRDNGFLITGYSMSSDGDASNNEGFHDNWFVKLDSSGNIEWEKSYGFAGHDHSYAIIQTQDGGYFSAGFLDITASGGEGGLTKHGVGEFWGQKINAQGELEWRNFFGGTNNDRSYSVLQSTDGGFVMFGATESTDFDITSHNGSYDFWIVKINASGEMVWQKTYGGSGIDIAYEAVLAADNSYVVVGQTISNDGDVTDNHGDSDFWVIKIDDDGNLIWKKSFGGLQFDVARSIDTTFDGGFVISGASKSSSGDLSANHGDNDFWVIKIDNSGNLQWEKNFGGAGFDFSYDVIETSTGHLLAVGETNSNNLDETENKGLLDLMVIKIK